MFVILSSIDYTNLDGKVLGTAIDSGDDKYAIAVLRPKCYVEGICARSLKVILQLIVLCCSHVVYVITNLSTCQSSMG